MQALLTAVVFQVFREVISVMVDSITLTPMVVVEYFAFF
jgi:hypothetical protein